TFDEPFGNDVALRISSLEPEHYTRAGAAIRHASQDLLRQQASHRLLLVLSDGKPNDRDIYEGQYGVEDMRQAVTEAILQGISAFCLTLGRQTPAYLPRIFGARNYALLPRTELLPTVLLDWMKRLVVRRTISDGNPLQMRVPSRTVGLTDATTKVRSPHRPPALRHHPAVPDDQRGCRRRHGSSAPCP